ncbi:hypothetical protein TRFO_27707 [Tritrichomonas foetus]|uniref:Transmembrane protein n=1 Tax=Tritrichomonas foetus TaxID=1144522 RepID=A0A1J4K1P1_9EUKA|nr:hypothetical protein TRFO_27707 [Tritrichomonas foetus]|eukprot:OHT04704.1 hypothetical protein TRFO_27707 [Tritrichomonas foetus]
MKNNSIKYTIHQANSSDSFGISMGFCKKNQILFIGDTDYSNGQIKGAVFAYKWVASEMSFKLHQIIGPENSIFRNSIGFGLAITLTSNCNTIFISSEDGVQVFELNNSMYYQQSSDYPIIHTDNFGKTLFYDHASDSLLATDDTTLYQINFANLRNIIIPIFACNTTISNVQFLSDRYYYLQCHHQSYVNVFTFNENNILTKQDYNIDGEYFVICPFNTNLSLIYQDSTFYLQNWIGFWNIYQNWTVKDNVSQIFFPNRFVFACIDDTDKLNSYQLQSDIVVEEQSIHLCGTTSNLINHYFISDEEMLTICKGLHSVNCTVIELTGPSSKMYSEVTMIFAAFTGTFFIFWNVYFIIFFVNKMKQIMKNEAKNSNKTQQSKTYN